MSGVRDTNSVEWRAKFERVKADGFSRLRALWVVREILCPIVCKLLTWLCVPYIFAKGVFPLLGYSVRTNSSVYHFAWLAYLLLTLLCYIVKKLYMYLASLHDRIKDERYLIGTTLCNFQQEDATTHLEWMNEELLSCIVNNGVLFLFLCLFLLEVLWRHRFSFL